MAIPTSRTKEKALVYIDDSRCNGCGLCVEVCKDYGLTLRDGKASTAPKPIFGCIACGHCMAVCPLEAIKVNGRCLAPQDLFELPTFDETACYGMLLSLLQQRRSIREFKDTPVESILLEKVLEAAKTAPMGLPPSDVNIVIFSSKEKVRDFTVDFCNYLEEIRWFVSDWFLTLMSPFWGKTNDEMFRGFIRPCFKAFTASMRKGENIVTYDAPVAMYFYGSPYTDPADPLIAATYAMLAAESLGLGTCMLGSIHPMIQFGGKARKIREKYGIKYKSREGVFVIMGYPRVKYQKGIKRTFASVETI